jgi:3-oxoacyl-(acyl-carrier-protein) synthase III
MNVGVKMIGVSGALPESVRTSIEVESIISSHPGNYKPRKGIVEAMSGIRERRVAAHDEQCSDLAARACRKVLEKTRVDPGDVDLLIYASAGQDLIEPATAHIVQAKLGSNCAVFDVKNACNSFLNGMQLAESLISTGTCRMVLVAVGEAPTRGVDWSARSVSEFKRNMPGYTMGDAGAAALFSVSDDGRGIFFRDFASLSRHWNLTTISGGGSMHPRGDEYTYLRADSAHLKRAFRELGLPFLRRAIHKAGVSYADFRRFFVHQVSLPYLNDMLLESGIPVDRVEITVTNHGNIAAASIPVGMAQAWERGAIGPGDRVMCLGLASGISIGVVMMDL